jgi:hypothetical protein
MARIGTTTRASLRSSSASTKRSRLPRPSTLSASRRLAGDSAPRLQPYSIHHVAAALAQLVEENLPDPPGVLTRDANEMPVQAKSGRPRLIAATHARPASQPPLNRLLVIGQRPLLEQLIPTHRGHRRTELACTSSPIDTVVDSLMVGDLRMWLYRTHSGNPRQMRRRRPPSASDRTPPPAGLRLHPV